MITTVTLNPAIDRTIILEHLKHGSTNRVKSVREDIGGKGVNVAKVLQSLGTKSYAIGFMGEKNSQYVKSLLAEEELDYNFIWVDGKTRLNTKVVELDTKLTTDINEAGFYVTQKQLDEMKQLVKKYSKQSEIMVFSGSIPQGMPSDLYYQLMSITEPCTKTVLDADGVFLLEGLKANPYLIKPNIYELENALSRKLDTHDQIKEAARELIHRYKIQYVLVSMGGDGSLLVSVDQAIFAKALKVEVKSSVGAGDSMLAGFIYGLENYPNDMYKALAYATACGALAVNQEGTQTFKKEDVEKIIAQVEMKLL